MQDVKHDGSLGEEQKFDLEKMQELLQQTAVDHVKVYNEDHGNKLSEDEIYEKEKRDRIREIVQEELQKELKKETVKKELLELKSEFDKRNGVK